MIVVEMTEKQVKVRHVPFLKLETQFTHSGPRIENEDAISATHLDAGAVSAILDRIGLRRGDAPASTPNLYRKTRPLHVSPHP